MPHPCGHKTTAAIAITAPLAERRGAVVFAEFAVDHTVVVPHIAGTLEFVQERIECPRRQRIAMTGQLTDQDQAEGCIGQRKVLSQLMVTPIIRGPGSSRLDTSEGEGNDRQPTTIGTGTGASPV
jgi:hypothetical protein